MTTSSDPNGKAPPTNGVAVTHWQELSQRLPKTATERLSDWIDAQLADLEKSQERFMTGRSIMKSLRR
jgi:hypothetical protein